MIIPINKITPEDASIVGGKGANLARLTSLGYRVPRGFCISTHIYRRFIDSTGLNHRINAELKRGNMDTMRWEELWDTSLRIRNFFRYRTNKVRIVFVRSLLRSCCTNVYRVNAEFFRCIYRPFTTWIYKSTTAYCSAYAIAG